MKILLLAALVGLVALMVSTSLRRKHERERAAARRIARLRAHKKPPPLVSSNVRGVTSTDTSGRPPPLERRPPSQAA